MCLNVFGPTFDAISKWLTVMEIFSEKWKGINQAKYLFLAKNREKILGKRKLGAGKQRKRKPENHLGSQAFTFETGLNSLYFQPLQQWILYWAHYQIHYFKIQGTYRLKSSLGDFIIGRAPQDTRQLAWVALHLWPPVLISRLADGGRLPSLYWYHGTFRAGATG